MSGSKTLNLKGIIPAFEETKKTFRGLPQRVQKYVHDIGLKLHEQPIDRDGKPIIPETPKNPDGSASLEPLDETSLMNLFAQLVAYKEYMDTHLSNLESKRIGLQREIKLLGARLHLQLPPPESSKKARIIVDPRYMELEDEEAELLAKISTLAKLCGGAESEIKMISRELTRRLKEHDKVYRANNAGKRGRSGIPGGRLVR